MATNPNSRHPWFGGLCLPAAVILPALATLTNAGVAPKPLFDDPNYHGACDPAIVWNDTTQEWLIFYTARRAMRPEGDVAAACPIGVARSSDWRQWSFQGYCKFDGTDDQADASHTYWAPTVVVDGATLHMYVTFRAGTNTWWGTDGEGIRHYVARAKSPLDWRLVGKPLRQPEAIDAGIVRKGNQWLLFYRDQDKSQPRGTTTFWATSRDMTNWVAQGAASGDVNDFKVTGFNYQEAQYPFRWLGSYWLLTDPSGPPMAVYRSDDAQNWQRAGIILDQPGKHPTDKSFGRHPSVAVVGERAFIVYHVEPDRDYRRPYPKQPLENRRCYLQMAELHYANGMITCDRDQPVDLPSLAGKSP